MNDTYPGFGFRGGICACMSARGRLKRRYEGLKAAKAAAEKMTLDAWVYACPSEAGIYHTTTKPRPDATYIYESRKES